MNILIPMAGAGSRFFDAGYTDPKPLIQIEGKTMIQRVIENLDLDGNFIFLIRREHLEKYPSLEKTLPSLTDNCRIVEVAELTEGAACTALLAKEFINNDEDLLIANSDQYVVHDGMFDSYRNDDSSDGIVWTFNSTNPHHSYVKMDNGGVVTEVAEKKVISDIATCGIYWYNKGSDFVENAEKMISDDVRFNNEFYIAPVYNQMIKSGKTVRTYPVEKMYSLGTPEELNLFLEKKVLEHGIL
ncbi:glycosyltransferase family 2 protein [Hyphomonas sp.]|jgi:dTDP-glucose pyrophosphorylase|uniref:glycosyltransferase family 2 protein n=1 Tax=Hyphomonas sp. TaxID=87 RepID=UPI0025B89DC1|nr:glycosyltransferase family 2 protein [Hyphomonas sp.]